MAAAPVWQRDVAAEGARGGGAQAESLSIPAQRFQDVDQLTKTFGHVMDVSKEFRRESDLHDLLASTSKEDTYQQHIQGSPSPLRPMSSAFLELPTMVQEKHSSCQTMCFTGLFPQIKRAWASVDNSLFLWRYDKSSDVPVEYSGEDQTITCVCLTVPKPGIFLPAIRYIIVLCTTAEIVMLGVCPSRRGGSGTGEGSDDVPEDILLQPLPLYTIPTDNEIITCCVAGPAGRVFLGTADGHVHELSYHAGESWCQKRISKSSLVWNFRSLLPTVPSFFPTFGNWSNTPGIAQLVVDKERHILYALNTASGIKVFDLGVCGEGSVKCAAELFNVYAAAANAVGGKELFRGAVADRKAASIKYVAPIATSESSGLHLMAVTADGRRIYFSTHNLTGSGAYISSIGARGPPTRAKGTPATEGGVAAGTCKSTSAAREAPFHRRPETLVAVFVRAAVPHSAGGRAATGDLSRSAALEIVAAHYSSGCLLLSESAGGAGSGGATKLLVASRNTTVPSATLNTHTGSGFGYGGHTSYVVGGLRESVTELDNFVPGETTAVEAAPCRPVLGPEAVATRGGPGSDELVSAVWWPPPRFIMISTTGVIELEKRRPVELLMHILERNNPEQLRSFFQAYGSVEASAMCYLIATSGPSTTQTSSGPGLSRRSSASSFPCSSLGGGGVSALAARHAAAALDNPLLVGEARMPEDAALADGGYPHIVSGTATMGGGGNNGMYMGRAVDPNPGPSWSAGHRGLCLYVSRLLAPVYDKKIAASIGAKGGGTSHHADGVLAGQVLTCSFSDQTLQVLHERLKALFEFLGSSILRRQQRGYASRTVASATAAVPYGGGIGGGTAMPFGGAAPVGGYGAAGVGGLFGYGAGAVGAGTGVEEPTVVVHKRRRLEHAAQQEDEMVQRVRALVGRVREACTLLGLLSAYNLGRLAVRELGRVPGDMAKLANMTLRDLVQEADGQTMASRLIGGLVNEQIDVGMTGTGVAGTLGSSALVLGSGSASGDSVSLMLQDAAPSYFRQEDRKYYQASALLKKAEAAQPGPERDNLVKQAVALLVRVPLVVSLESLTNQLANLKYYEGIVTMALAVAAARDPEGHALRPELGPACELARQQRREAYNHVLGALRSLISADSSSGGGAGGGASVLTPSERVAFKSALLKTALASSDTFFLDELYGFLISSKAQNELLSRDAPGLESYLAREGGLVPPGGPVEPTTAAAATAAAAAAALSDGVPIGPLTKAQVTMLGLLCNLLVARRRFLDAALVRGALACRRSGPGPDLAVLLESRVAMLQSAATDARSAGDSALVSRLDSDAKVVGFQDSIAKRLQKRVTDLVAESGQRLDGFGVARAGGPQATDPSASLAELERALAELSGAPLELSALYNVYAQPFQLWDICLQMIRFAGGGGGGNAPEPSGIVRSLWDHELLQAYDKDRNQNVMKRLEAACDAVSRLGPSLYPDELTLPLVHVACRLECMAGGLWPVSSMGDGGAAATMVGEAADHLSKYIVGALKTAAGGSAAGVRRVYEALLSRGRGGQTAVTAMDPQLSSARMRVQLLRSAASACEFSVRDLESSSLIPIGADATAGMLGLGPVSGVSVAREAGSLADAADRFALEARRLGYPECEEIARRLDVVRMMSQSLR